MTNGPLGDTAADGSADAPVHADADAGVEVGDSVDNPHAAPSGFHVVGIGASAGGIEALREVLPDLPVGNVAYVIAQHMSAAHPSLLTQVLARETTMPVQEVAAGVRLQPGVVYVAPPNRDVEVGPEGFRARQAAPRISPQPSIDVLLESIALTYGTHAIGIVLSGTGSDGARGMQAIKAGRGFTIVQDPSDARYRDMPAATLETGVVDFIVEAAGVGRLLATILVGNTDLPLRASGRWADDPVMNSIARETSRITGWDISAYKDGTLGRQLSKRAAMLGLESTQAYHGYIVENPDELIELRDSMLITVTGFLRDRKAFDTLREAVNAVVRGKAPGDTVRAWVAGCATGEEAYSVAMMTADAVRERGNDLGIKIFATDISDTAMSVARRGVYHHKAIADIPPEWRERYFSSIQGEHVQVVKHLREMLVIARQDLTSDPPLVRMDLVTCRNLLIYLLSDVQARILRSFHVALNPKGLLFLGRSENIPADMDLFTTVNAPSKIYMKAGTTIAPHLGYVPPPRNMVLLPRAALATRRNGLTDELRDRMLSDYAPPSVLVDAAGTPIHQVGDLSRYLSLPESGDYRLADMIVPSLRTEVSSMLEKVLRDSIYEIAHNLIVRFPDGSAESVGVKVSRFTRAAARRSRVEDNEVFALVSFIPQPSQTTPDSAPRHPERSGAASDNELIDTVAELERELTGTQQHLQSVVGELESSNEELQAMNEELQASAEELQATNEELETTNEELQATNEELTTVNETLEVRTAELSETTVVLQNIQNAVHTAIVLVDKHQRVQQFSPLAVKVFGLVNSDLGTPLGALPTTIDIVGLEDRVQSVIDTGQGFLAEISSTATTYLMQIVAYRSESEIQGAVIALSDVTELARARTALAGISEEFSALTDDAPVALYRTGLDLITPIEMSPSIRDILGLDEFGPAFDPHRINDYIHPDDRARVMDHRIQERERDYQIDYRLITAGRETRVVREISRVISDQNNMALRRLGLVVDVTGMCPAVESAIQGNG